MVKIKQLPEITMSGLDGEALLTSIKRLQAEAAALREALEVVMWASLESGQVYCQWCAVSEGEEHLRDCQGHNALATDAGREMSAPEAVQGKCTCTYDIRTGEVGSICAKCGDQ